MPCMPHSCHSPVRQGLLSPNRKASNKAAHAHEKCLICDLVMRSDMVWLLYDNIINDIYIYIYLHAFQMHLNPASNLVRKPICLRWVLLIAFGDAFLAIAVAVDLSWSLTEAERGLDPSSNPQDFEIKSPREKNHKQMKREGERRKLI